ncbi:unnamed protein product [Callosobruchus maculatus]|uniref:Uncharacterized protein n=1 Tax=Callosobruchus maculatus TaxID=64391 RepID=A0A653CHD9_CALMS|nr:unnamed protein product [Callosobruchus maculatus]
MDLFPLESNPEVLTKVSGPISGIEFFAMNNFSLSMCLEFLITINWWMFMDLIMNLSHGYQDQLLHLSCCSLAVRSFMSIVNKKMKRLLKSHQSHIMSGL